MSWSINTSPPRSMGRHAFQLYRFLSASSPLVSFTSSVCHRSPMPAVCMNTKWKCTRSLQMGQKILIICMHGCMTTTTGHQQAPSQLCLHRHPRAPRPPLLMLTRAHSRTFLSVCRRWPRAETHVRRFGGSVCGIAVLRRSCAEKRQCPRTSLTRWRPRACACACTTNETYLRAHVEPANLLDQQSGRSSVGLALGLLSNFWL